MNNFQKENSNNHGRLQTRQRRELTDFLFCQRWNFWLFCLSPLPFWFATFSSLALNVTLWIRMYNPLPYYFELTIHIYSVTQKGSKYNIPCGLKVAELWKPHDSIRKGRVSASTMHYNKQLSRNGAFVIKLEYCHWNY